MEDRLLFVGQKALIEKDGKVLVLIDDKNRLDFPGGKIQVNDTSLEDALFREIKEEVDLAINISHPFAVKFYPSGYLKKMPKEGIYILVFQATYLKGEVQLSDEHISYEWVDKNSYTKYQQHNDEMNFFGILDDYFTR